MCPARLSICAAVFLGFALSQLPAATLEITFQHEYAGEPLRLDSLSYLTAADETLSFTRISYLLSGFALERQDHTWLEIPEQVAWIDAERQRLTARLEHLPQGAYVGLRFHLGPGSAANGDPSLLPRDHPLKPELNNLYWSRQAGYIFLALAGQYRGVSMDARGYACHLAGDCHAASIVIRIPIDLTKDAQESQLPLSLDFGTLLKTARAPSFARGPSSAALGERDPAATALAALLPSAFHVVRSPAPAPALSSGSPSANR